MSDPSPPTLHRSGAVARMLRMPVATLRVWERRYRLTDSQRSVSGQRLYSAEEVRRLALIRQLVDRGHAIGQLARLDMAQLQQIASRHARTLDALRTAPEAAPLPAAAATPAPVPPRRWDDAALADMAGLSSTIACECPQHVAELLIRLSHFEAYSAQCEQRSPADAELHAWLGRIAAQARARFEEALERIARQEGLLLPPGSRGDPVG
ncbi:MAG: MerR family transcriptional regulator [Burkholderiaceae bacterium]|nr:MerR family transcriptional regulator [Burkholderiaceae bacterium]